MTTTGVHRPPPEAAPAPALALTAISAVRTGWLYLISRRLPAAIGLLAAAGAVLWAALHWHWSISGGPAAQQFMPLTIEAAAAAIVAVTTSGPFGDTERAAGRWLPCLRLCAALALTAAAVGALAAGAAAGHLPGGSLAMVRNLTGMAGIGLLSAAAFRGAFGWTGPLAYLIITEGAFAGLWTTPWDWPTRPPHDLGGAVCATIAFAAGIAVITVLGARDAGRRAAPD
jgi:hypothetical protein